MNAKHVATLAMRVLGLCLLFECIKGIGWLWPLAKSQPESGVGVMLSLTLFFLIGGILFLGGQRIAAFVLRSDSEDSAGEGGLRQVQAMAFSVIGLWFGAHALAQATLLACRMWMAAPGYFT
ncbi:MAG: hypothetical protein O7B99_11310, partial [Planctomycetota bacterium]|nr:hypothetical protein [Planctomycetota bacterium]